MKIFITGGSGFVGKNLIRKLIKERHLVTALSRSAESDTILKSLGATPVRGTLDNADNLQVHLKNSDVVIHCAAPVEFWGPWKKFETGIVLATKNLAQSASAAGVKRFIHLSSESVLQDRGSLVDISENHPYPKKANSSYGEAKKMAEQFLLSYQTAMEVIILRPTFIYGNGSANVQAILEKAQKGEFVWINKGASEFEAVHVENVVQAIVCALNNGTTKNVYVVTDGKARTVREFFSELFISAKVPLPKYSLPKLPLFVLAFILEAIWNVFNINRPPPITKFDLAFVSQPRRYDIQRTTNDLGFRPSEFSFFESKS